MSSLFHLDVDFDGRRVVLRYEVPAEAHIDGLTGSRWRRERRVPFGDLTHFGAQIIAEEMLLACGRLSREMRGAWEQDELPFDQD